MDWYLQPVSLASSAKLPAALIAFSTGFLLMLETRYKGKLYSASKSCNEGYKSNLYTARMSIGQRIRSRREAVGKSQKRLAKDVGVSYQSVQQWEFPDHHPKHTNPRSKYIEKIAAALSNEKLITTQEYLIFGDDSSEKGELKNPPELEKLFSDIKGLAQENMRLLYVYVDLLIENQRLKNNNRLIKKSLKQ
jgi:transcriptional regulator with XRE-family HTH domain